MSSICESFIENCCCCCTSRCSGFSVFLYLQCKPFIDCCCSCCSAESIESEMKSDIQRRHKNDPVVVNLDKKILEISEKDQIPNLEIPVLDISNGSITSNDDDSFKIKNNLKRDEYINLQIKGDKKIHFSLAKGKESSKLIRCGVIINSSFTLDNNNNFTYMLAYLDASVELKTSICLHFLNSLEDCQNYLKDGAIEQVEYIDTISTFNRIIPFKDIVDSAAGKPIENIKIDSQAKYTKCRNSIKFIEKFARECGLPISIKLKTDLMSSMIYKYYNHDNRANELEKIKTSKGLEKYWNNYTETDSNPETQAYNSEEE